ncbi:MAG: methionine ABC transporter ATP-binding protein [Proteobacteria bacterium]|nr:MAG: methionine ABC transporter ATP-binding protein [Pseudomonadota bacterium]
MIKISNLHKSYGEVEVLSGINLHIKEKEIYALVGHSGAGKSTLLRCLNGLESYDKGRVEVFGKDVKRLDPKKLRQLRREMGMIFQHFSLMSQKNVYENVAMPMRVWKYPKSSIDKKVKELLDLVGLSDKIKSYPNELSGGQKQRVAVARALTLEPKILLSDEATSALDPNTTLSILELLKMINKELGLTIVLVTHEMDVVKSIADKAMLLEHGKIIANGKIEELFLNPNEKMKSFLAHEEILPKNGINIRLYFPKEVAFQSLITSMAIKLGVNFNIVWGNIEKLNESVVGHLVININENDKKIIVDHLKQSGVLWEIV